MKSKTSSALPIAMAALFLGMSWSAQTAENPPIQFKVQGGASFKNLQVFFLTGEDRIKGIQYMPLDEAMGKGIARINETGNVRSLTVENLSSEHNVFVNSGDIIKGGRQDRYLANSLVVPPESGKVSLASFCVESGRWSQRGGESARLFSASRFMASSREQRLAAQYHMDQSKLWKQVAKSKLAYNRLVVRRNSSLTPVPAGSQGSPQSQAELALSLAARTEQLATTRLGSRYSTSLQLALENKQLQGITKEYVDHMNGNLSEYDDAIGFVFAINGEIASADVYGQSGLFSALWPKLINAAATEAVAKQDAKKKVKPLKREDFVAFFTNQKKDSPNRRELNNETLLVTTKGDKHILFETRDLRVSTSWLHQSYLATP